MMLISKKEKKIVPNEFKSHELPDLKTFSCDNKDFFYFDNFNLINLYIIKNLEDN